MSLILSKQVGYNVHRTFCEVCGVECDTLNNDELSGMVLGGYRILCPACEGRVPEYHPIFLWTDGPFWVVIDGVMFCIDWPASVREVERRWEQRLRSFIAFVNGVLPDNSGLSACLVSTKVNRVYNNEVENG